MPTPHSSCPMMMMIAFITFKRSLVSCFEGAYEDMTSTQNSQSCAMCVLCIFHPKRQLHVSRCLLNPLSLIVSGISRLSLAAFITCAAGSFAAPLTNFSLLFTLDWSISASPSSEASIFPGTVQLQKCLCTRNGVWAI